MPAILFRSAHQSRAGISPGLPNFTNRSLKSRNSFIAMTDNSQRKWFNIASRIRFVPCSLLVKAEVIPYLEIIRGIPYDRPVPFYSPHSPYSSPIAPICCHFCCHLLSICCPFNPESKFNRPIRIRFALIVTRLRAAAAASAALHLVKIG
jgi:hypothetical protein